MLDRLHKQKQNSKENLNSQTLSDNKTINNQNTNFKDKNLKNINLSNSKDNLNFRNQLNLQNNIKQNSKNSDKNLNSNKNNNSSNSINQRDYDENSIIIYDRTELVIKNSIILIYFMIATLVIKGIFFMI